MAVSDYTSWGWPVRMCESSCAQVTQPKLPDSKKCQCECWKSHEINHRPLHSYIMQTHMQGQTCCILPRNGTWGTDMVAYIGITTWAWGQISRFQDFQTLCILWLHARHSSKIIIAWHFVVCKCHRQQQLLLFWGWSLILTKEGSSLQTDPRSKITEVNAYVSPFLSSETAKINQAVTVTVNSCLSFSFWEWKNSFVAFLRPNI